MENEEVIESLTFIENLEEDEEERQRRLRRRQRIEEMKRQKHKTELMHRCVLAVSAVLMLFVGFGIGALIRFHIADDTEVPKESVQETQPGSNPGQTAGYADKIRGILQGGDFGELQGDDAREETWKPDQENIDVDVQPEMPLAMTFEAFSTAVTAGFEEQIISEYGVLIDVEAQEILARRDDRGRINPASMTKVLTVLTAADALGITDGTEAVLDDTFTMTRVITDYCYVNDCSIAGFSLDEQVTVRDLFYGTILPSGADAAVGLAIYVAGSQEAFVELMNEKLEAMELSETTHFTNCVGLYNEDHYSSVYDIAVILKETADNPFCREVLSAHTYNTAFTEQHPEGILLSNWFLRRIEDRDTHGEVLCGKTGFVNQSGSCAASLAVDVNGREYLCVTAGSSSPWQCIDDQHMLYQKYLPGE